MTIQELSKETATYFETRKRADGESFICCKDNRPDWITDMIHDAHGDMLPDDYRYRWIVSALDDFTDSDDDPDDMIGEYVDSTVDSYTADLTAWLASNVNRVYYLTQAMGEMDPSDGFQALSCAQYSEISEVYYTVYHVLEGRVAGLELEEA